MIKLKTLAKLKNMIREEVKRTLSESTISGQLEMIGPDVSELLDAINTLNGSHLSGQPFKFKDSVKLKPLDKTGHTINRNKFSIEVIPTVKSKSAPDENTYLRDANSFLKSRGFECKLFKTN